jgi:hypothetical protein
MPPDPDEPELPLMPPDEPELPPDAPCPELACPSPCDDPPRSRLEPLDDPPVLPEPLLF